MDRFNQFEVIWKNHAHSVLILLLYDSVLFFLTGLFAEVTYLSNLVLSFGVLNILFAIMVPPSWVGGKGVVGIQISSIGWIGIAFWNYVLRSWLLGIPFFGDVLVSQNTKNLERYFQKTLGVFVCLSNLRHLNKYDSHTAVWSPSLTSQFGPWVFWMSCVQTSTQRFNKSILPGWTVRFSMFFFLGGGCDYWDLGRDCWLPWNWINWTGHLGFDPHGNHNSIRFKRKIWVLFQYLSFQVSRKPPKTTNIHDQDDDHLQWNAGRGPDSSMGVQCQHIFFWMDMWIIIMWFT